ncbi:MAG: hypothetical protein MZU97_19915 [Bacillus subtilis]|nr:hypothetical protein [Bacillus subtilis]
MAALVVGFSLGRTSAPLIGERQLIVRQHRLEHPAGTVVVLRVPSAGSTSPISYARRCASSLVSPDADSLIDAIVELEKPRQLTAKMILVFADRRILRKFGAILLQIR